MLVDRARAGEIKGFTGIDDPYEAPTSPELRLTPADGGNKLEVRGYVGMPLLGRTQTWIRVE